MKYPRQNIDVCILTDPRYVNINEEDPYCQNILKEDGLVRESLEKRGLRVDGLEEVKNLTRMINSYEIIKWNLDKHYLLDLTQSGIPIPPTLILKPFISGGARHTYRFLPNEAGAHEKIYQELVKEEAMMIQEFQEQVPLKGEVAFMLIDGQFSHAILKKAREGDFRVQDDFGGTVHHYQPSDQEIYFAEDALATAIMRTYFTD